MNNIKLATKLGMVGAILNAFIWFIHLLFYWDVLPTVNQINDVINSIGFLIQIVGYSLIAFFFYVLYKRQE